MARINPADRSNLDNEGKLACSLMWHMIKIAENLFKSFHYDILTHRLISPDKHSFCLEMCKMLGAYKFSEFFKRLYPDKYSSKAFLWLRENYARLGNESSMSEAFYLKPLSDVTLEDCQ